MFGTKTDIEPAPVVVETADDLIPLSHFALDHPQPPEGWSNFLGRQGITLRPDDIGRDSIRRHDAQMLLHEQRASQLRAVKRHQLAEAEAVEADQRRRALIWKGVSADAIPVGVHPATAMLQAAKDAQPKRLSPLEESLSGESMVYHTYPLSEDES